MSKTELQDWLLGNSGFQDRYRCLVMDSVASQFTGLTRLKNRSTSYDWGYLLTCASLFTQSDDARFQDAALRIAQFCLEQSEVDDTIKDAAAVVLDSMANQPSIDLAVQRHLIKTNFSERLPFTLYQDWTKRSIKYSIALPDSKMLPVNRFQRHFWDQAQSHDWVSLSAPTSAGKSYILGHWLAAYLSKSPHATIIYLVPTRALIQQVQTDIESMLEENAFNHIAVTTLPLRSYIKSNVANIMIFTQERYHILLGEIGTDIRVDLLIVDESQKIGDGYRGVLLQQAIERSLHNNARCRVIFASPMTLNPELLLEDAPEAVSVAAMSSEDIMVNQNLLWVSQVGGRPTVWDVELILNGSPAPLGRIELPDRPSPESKRLPFVAFALGDPKGGNVVYANGAAYAETTAKQIYDLRRNHDLPVTDKEILELIELIHKTIHPRYSLAAVLRRGIAFHYGNMPLLIRSEIERLFRDGKIHFLICTSTLIEGVNMPCRSIFARGPTKGLGQPMTPSDFWNLAGRAGRWGKEFQGNVVCVDVRQEKIWEDGPPRLRESSGIKRTSDEVIAKTSDFLSFIESGTLREEARKHPDYEYVFSYLMTGHILYGSVRGSTWVRRYPTAIVERVAEVISRATQSLVTPASIILRNPGISPIAMDSLLNYFLDRTENRKEPVEELLPVLPESEDASTEYTRILNRVNKYLGDVFGRGKRVGMLALLIVQWMRGHPLARIIDGREKYYGSDNLASLIRNTMKDVEEIARFQAPKFLSCYTDLLRFHLETIGRPDLIERLFDLNVFLEFGVSQKTQLSLISLGLTRSSAITLSVLISDSSLDENGCVEWLRNNNWMTEDMPALIKRDISKVLSSKGIL